MAGVFLFPQLRRVAIIQRGLGAPKFSFDAAAVQVKICLSRSAAKPEVVE